MNETENFQHYQVLRREDGSLWELGRGAMGVTYKAFDVNLRCDVALKVISSQFLDSEMARARFLREARAAAGLRHRNVASVYHLGNDAESFFYSMEFIDGQTVEALVNTQGPLPAVTALRITRQVTRALGAAAKQGVVHRDIKPANLMVVHEDEEEDEEGFVVKVIDFGLARSAMAGGEQSGHITMGGFVGTPQYASPEQIEEKDLDVRSDIYSLGITLWYMLAGQPPFTGTVFRISSQHLSKEPPWDDIAATTPEPVRALLGRMIQKDPNQRPQSPAKLRSEIEECLRQLPSGSGAQLSAAPALASGNDTLIPDDSSASATIIQGPAPTVGRIFAGRYQLNSIVGEGASGQIFRAYDGRLDGKLVAFKVLHPELNLSPQAFYHLQGDQGRLRDAPHPQLIETSLLERVHGYKYGVMEWVNGYPLAELLRRGASLTLPDALRLLGLASDAAAHCSAHRLHRLELSPQKILLQFPELDEEADPPAAEVLALKGLGQWPKFTIKIDPLAPAREANRTSAKGSGANSPRVAGRDTLSSIRGLVEGSYFYALGALLYELLAATPPAPGESSEAPPLDALSEAGNAALRQAFSTNPGYSNENEWFHAVLQACDLRREDVGLSRPLVEASSSPVARTAVRPAIAPATTHAPKGVNPMEARPPQASPPVEARVRPPAVPTGAKPAAPIRPPEEAEKTLARNEAATLVRPERIVPPPAPVEARVRPAAPVAKSPEPAPPPAPITPVVEPPAVKENFSPVVEPLASRAKPREVIPPIVSESPKVPPGVAEPMPSVVENLAEAATFAPVEAGEPEPPVLRDEPQVEPRPAARNQTPRPFPLRPLLAVGGVVVLGGIIAMLTLGKSRPTDGREGKREVSTTASPAFKPFDTGSSPAATPPATVANVTPSPRVEPPQASPPAVMNQQLASNTPPPPIPPASPAVDIPVVMEVVPDSTPAPTTVLVSDRPVTPANTPPLRPPVPEGPTPTAAPTASPRRENKASISPTPKVVRPPPTPAKIIPPEKTNPKPKPTPAKPLKATPPPQNADDVPGFMR